MTSLPVSFLHSTAATYSELERHVRAPSRAPPQATAHVDWLTRTSVVTSGKIGSGKLRFFHFLKFRLNRARLPACKHSRQRLQQLADR